MNAEEIMIMNGFWHLPSYIINFVIQSGSPSFIFMGSLVVQQEAQDSIYGIVFKVSACSWFFA